MPDSGVVPLTPQSLTTYRLFWTNRAGRIDAVAETIEAVDDDHAIRQAQERAGGRAAEIWAGARRVAMLNGTSRR